MYDAVASIRRSSVSGSGLHCVRTGNLRQGVKGRIVLQARCVSASKDVAGVEQSAFGLGSAGLLAGEHCRQHDPYPNRGDYQGEHQASQHSFTCHLQTSSSEYRVTQSPDGALFKTTPQAMGVPPNDGGYRTMSRLEDPLRWFQTVAHRDTEITSRREDETRPIRGIRPFLSAFRLPSPPL